MIALLRTYLALLMLLLLTVSLSFIPLGPFSVAASFSIAVAKTFFIMTVFMQLNHTIKLTRLVALVGFAWLLILFLLSFVDYFFRNIT